MSSGVKNFPSSRIMLLPARSSSYWSSSGAVRVSQLCKLAKCEQVAAVCYRVRNGAIEFLLIQTRGSRRWTFPKGSAEPGLTHAQAAAIEAFEEAGVHGRIEESPFVRYICNKPGSRPSAKGSGGLAVSAHLCEVRKLCKPRESGRNRTWFSVEEAGLRLRKGREEADGDTFAQVVEHAAARIQRLCREQNPLAEGAGSNPHHSPVHSQEAMMRDPLRRVHLEARFIHRLMPRGSIAPRLVTARHTVDEVSESGLQFMELPSRNLSLLTRPQKKLKA
jgi:ADP-ribose pyrophosphatase YjhB (NUDIX family)